MTPEAWTFEQQTAFLSAFEVKCPKCGKDLLKRSGRYGEFVGCSGFPACKFTCSMDDLKDLGKKEKTTDKI